MPKGTNSFISFGWLSAGAILLVCLVTGSALPLLAGVGIFVVLTFANRLG